ncbi:hypothetical protein MMC28_006365 [Mycoblastus sanguinarius]|nr:hypothetical protein [Mycoblastus sanguinarius]
MKIRSAVWPASLVTRPVLGALVGYGIYPYKPPCAHACYRSLSSLMLECSSDTASEREMDSDSEITSPQCRAGETPWLTSLAWCMCTNCAEYNVSTSGLERFWEEQCTGDPTVAPKWGYSTTLFNIAQSPTRELTETDDTLNITALVNPAVYEAQYNALTTVQRENVVESGYRYGIDPSLVGKMCQLLICEQHSIAILVTGFGTPIFLTWMGYVPYMSGVLNKIKPYLVYPSIIGTYQVRPLPYLLGNAPTVGQSLYIVMFFILNVVLTAVNYESRQPHAWYATQRLEITAFIFYRTGVLAFVMAPLVILFSSRNNFLLWVTNWSHSTFLLLHRWVARIFALQVLLHSLLALPLYYPSEAKKGYWIWGAVATVAVMILVFASGLYVRLFVYEFFLITHILLSVFVIIGCWYHIKLWIGLTWGYETWLYAACAVWFFDRLARAGRIFKTGLRRAKVTDLGGGYFRVDVVGIRWGSTPGKHVYAYFPTLNPLRFWENHPFSVIPTALLQPSCRSLKSEVVGSTAGLDHIDMKADHIDMERHDRFTEQAETMLESRPTIGLTLFIRKSRGITKHLQADGGLLTLFDGPYCNNPSKEVLRCDRLLLIGGGIGITGLLPWVANHWNVRLCWSVKETAKCLVEAMDGVLSGIAEKDVKVGQRLSVSELLAKESDSGWCKVGVVVSGPGGLCDNVRAAVAAAGKKGNTVFELEVDAYSW